MSEGNTRPYKLEDGASVKEQVRSIKTVGQQAGKLERFIEIMEKVGEHLRTNPNEWGDPEYAAKTVNAVIRRGIVRPVAIRYAVYEDARAVVILNVRLFAKFA
jgi:hypothetical protein